MTYYLSKVEKNLSISFSRIKEKTPVIVRGLLTFQNVLNRHRIPILMIHDKPIVKRKEYHNIGTLKAKNTVMKSIMHQK